MRRRSIRAENVVVEIVSLAKEGTCLFNNLTATAPFFKRTSVTGARLRELLEYVYYVAITALVEEIQPGEAYFKRNLQELYRANQSTYRLGTDFPGCASSGAID